MNSEPRDSDFDGFWRRLQAIGLNAYEARTYLILVGHPKFKALELAARAGVPRQKIYEVLDSLAEKGFANVVQERTKLFSAIDPGLAIPNYVARRHRDLERELAQQSRSAGGLVEDLQRSYSRGQEGLGTLDYLRIVTEPGLAAQEYRRMLGAATTEYLEFWRPPYASDPRDDQLVRDACGRGVNCRILIAAEHVEPDHLARIESQRSVGVQVRVLTSLPMKLALFDGRAGMIALLDPLVTKPAWTSVAFDHPGMAEAMHGLFEDYWNRARELDAAIV